MILTNNEITVKNLNKISKQGLKQISGAAFRGDGCPADGGTARTMKSAHFCEEYNVLPE